VYKRQTLNPAIDTIDSKGDWGCNVTGFIELNTAGGVEDPVKDSDVASKRTTPQEFGEPAFPARKPPEKLIEFATIRMAPPDPRLLV
jgi:hypothetical protein